jgi:endonuclease/exonuclease/phosphatase family metal-dependent hydrolase
MLAVAGALALQGQQATASDITLSLDMSVFPLDLEGGSASFIAALLDDQGNLVVIDNGTPNTSILGLTTLVPIPDTYEDVKLDVATMQWSSPSQLAYSLDVSLMNIDQHTNAGWIAEEIMTVPELSVPATGRLPATPEAFNVSLECVAPGKARIQFQFSICEEAAATWENSCSEGATQVVTFVVDKECGDSNALPDFCMPDTPPALSESGESASVSIFNLNVAEGAGIDRTKLVEKGTAIAAVVALEGSDVACLQEVWDEGERAALTEGLATAGLSHSVTARGAGLLIASRFPIVWCSAATFPADSYGGTIESFSNKGVLGALLDIGGGAMLYVFVTHMAAFSDLSGSQAQLETIKHEIDSQLSQAAAIYGPAGRIGAVVMGDFNLNAATEEVRKKIWNTNSIEKPTALP